MPLQISLQQPNPKALDWAIVVGILINGCNKQ